MIPKSLVISKWRRLSTLGNPLLFLVQDGPRVPMEEDTLMLKATLIMNQHREIMIMVKIYDLILNLLE